MNLFRLSFFKGKTLKECELQVQILQFELVVWLDGYVKLYNTQEVNDYEIQRVFTRIYHSMYCSDKKEQYKSSRVS